jgi:nucleoid DNA-binding protein/cell division septation protein DedD
MSIDLIEYVNHLLHRNNVAILPGFGALVATPTPALIDHARGTIYPPSKVITFNENLKVNDGLLMNHIKNIHGVSHQDARSIVENFVSSVMAILREGEPVRLDKIGKFYLNAQGRIVFEAIEKSNFNVETYGLPTLKYYPIAQSARANTTNSVADTPAPKAASVPKVQKIQSVDNQNITSEIPAEKSTPSSSVLRWLPSRRTSLLAASIIGASLLTAVILFNNQQKGTTSEDSTNAVTVSENRVNVKPHREENSTDEPTDATSPFKDETVDKTLSQTDNVVAGETTPSVTATPEKSVTPSPSAVVENADKSSNIVFIGSFSNEKNAVRAARKIKRKGFEVYREKVNGMRRVGTPIFFSSDAEKNKAISRMRRLFGKQCWERK